MFSFAHKHVLIVSPEPWGEVRMSKHHYAEALVHHKAKVTFLEPYDPEAPVVRKTETITVVNGFKPTPGLRFLPRFLRIHLALRDAKRLLAVTDAVDVVWSFDNSRLFDLDVFEDAYLIHHCMDANMDFQLARTVRHAHVNLAVTDEIAERMAKARWRYRLVSNVCKVPHGWAGYKTGQIEVPAASGKRAFYAGNLAIGYIHWDWLLSLIGAHSEVEFVFAGNADPEGARPEFKDSAAAGIAQLQAASNVTLLGRIPARHLPDWYAASDVLLLVYDFERFGPQVYNSHKLTEYLASGTPVVATWTKAFEEDDFLPMAETLEELHADFLEALQLAPETDVFEGERVRYAEYCAYPNLVNVVARYFERPWLKA